MGPRNSHLHVHQRSRPVSEDSEEDELHEPGVHVSSAGVSPPFSDLQQSQSGSSSHAGEYVHLPFPSELQEPEVYPYDSASRLDTRVRPQASRHNSSRRENPHHRRAQTAPRPRTRAPPSESSSEESGDSAEDFLGRPGYAGMPRPQSQYGPGPNGYPQSSSSGSNGYPYGYPAVPQSNQVVQYAPQQPQPGHPHYPQHHPYPPPMASPPPAGYPPAQPYHHDPRARSDPNHPGSPHYRPPPGYGPAAMMPYGHQGYFPQGYGPPPGYPQYHPGGPAPYLPPFLHDWQVASHSRKASPPPDKKDTEKAVVVAAAPPSAPPPPPAQPSQEEIIKRMQDILLAANSERDAREKERQLAIQSAEDQVTAIRKAEQERAKEEARIRAEAVRMAKEQAEAAAKAQAERAAHEQRIREDAIRAAQQAIAEKAAKDAEQAAREARIREEAARAALEKAAADAKAKADQEAKEKKIAADAAKAAKTAAEEKAAKEAAEKEAAAKKASEEADAKLKAAEADAKKKLEEAEAAAAKAKTEAEVAKAAEAAAKPPEKKAPVRFKDAIGRNYNFPWERCCKWRDMENLIVQAFQHIEDLGEHVINGRYDLIGPDKDIIMPQYWDYIVQPDMHITMMLWPLPEKPAPPPPPGPAPQIIDASPLMMPPPVPEGVIDLDELLNPKKKNNNKGKKPSGGAFANWMLGGAPSRNRKSLKGNKKPGIAAG